MIDSCLILHPTSPLFPQAQAQQLHILGPLSPLAHHQAPPRHTHFHTGLALLDSGNSSFGKPVPCKQSSALMRPCTAPCCEHQSRGFIGSYWYQKGCPTPPCEDHGGLKLCSLSITLSLLKTRDLIQCQPGHSLDQNFLGPSTVTG